MLFIAALVTYAGWLTSERLYEEGRKDGQQEGAEAGFHQGFKAGQDTACMVKAI